jgi:hypothetical protein
MRSFFLGSLALGVFSASLAVGCGDSGGTTGSGGSGTGGGTTTTNSGGGTNGTGGSAACTTVGLEHLRVYQTGSYLADVTPELGAAADDILNLAVYPTDTTTSWSGAVTLGTGENANYATCSTCVLVYQDLPAMDGDPEPTIFFATAGTVDFGSATLSDQDTQSVRLTDGSVTGLHLVEVTLDGMTGESTPVPGGKCLDIAMDALDQAPLPAGWDTTKDSCDPGFYDDDAGCDCECGVIDEDCSDAMQTIYGCQEGQTCDTTTATCAGLPTGWTCGDAEFNKGAGNGCDCNCGAHDPDCDLMPAETVQGCQAGDTCTPAGACLPAAWACNPAFFGDGADCDCGCGALDPDCTDATKASCDYCDDTGSCDTVACTDAASKINAANNAICN